VTAGAGLGDERGRHARVGHGRIPDRVLTVAVVADRYIVAAFLEGGAVNAFEVGVEDPGVAGAASRRQVPPRCRCVGGVGLAYVVKAVA